VLENKGDALNLGFEAEIDLRGLLVKEIGKEQELAGKIEGVYEMSRRELNTDLASFSLEMMENVQFLKARVMLKRTNERTKKIVQDNGQMFQKISI